MRNPCTKTVPKPTTVNFLTERDERKIELLLAWGRGTKTVRKRQQTSSHEGEESVVSPMGEGKKTTSLSVLKGKIDFWMREGAFFSPFIIKKGDKTVSSLSRGGESPSEGKGEW